VTAFVDASAQDTDGETVVVDEAYDFPSSESDEDGSSDEAPGFGAVAALAALIAVAIVARRRSCERRDDGGDRRGVRTLFFIYVGGFDFGVSENQRKRRRSPYPNRRRLQPFFQYHR